MIETWENPVIVVNHTAITPQPWPTIIRHPGMRSADVSGQVA